MLTQDWLNWFTQTMTNLFYIGGFIATSIGVIVLVVMLVNVAEWAFKRILRALGVYWYGMAYIWWQTGASKTDVEAALLTAIDDMERAEEWKKADATEENEWFRRRHAKIRKKLHRSLDGRYLQDYTLHKDQAAAIAPAWTWHIVERERARHSRKVEIGWHKSTGWFVASAREYGMTPVIVLTEFEREKLYGPL